jgi:UrcA family protein
MSRTFKIAIIAAFASIALAPVASAQSGRTGIEQVSVRVAYGDLDMSTMGGAQTLLKRIQGAARSVCKDAVKRSPLSPRSQSTCRRDTIGATVAQHNITTLTMAWNRTQPSSVQLSAR